MSFERDGLVFTRIDPDEDVELVQQIWNDEAVQRYDYVLDDTPYTRSEVEGTLTEWQNFGISQFKTVGSDGTPYGLIYVIPDTNLDKVAFIGQHLLPEHRGSGTGTRALKTFHHYLFKRKNIHKLKAATVASNHPARRFVEKCGYKREGTNRSEATVDGEYEDIITYGLLCTDWYKKN